MRRGLIIIITGLILGGSAYAERSKMDDSLRKRVERGGSETVRVIIQYRGAVSAGDVDRVGQRRGGKVLRQFDGIRALLAEVDVREIDGLSDGLNVARMSLDNDVHSTAASSSNGLARVVAGGAAAASMYSAIGRNIGVAVIDSGIRDVSDLEPVMKVDFIEDGRTSDTDPFGHGSHVAGIIGGLGKTDYGRYMGMAPEPVWSTFASWTKTATARPAMSLPASNG